MKIVLGLIIGYVCGSIPFSWIAVRLTKGVDIREYGSGTVSATMVGILVSKPLAVLVGCLDILKVIIPVYLIRRLAPDYGFACAAGIGALLGHNWSVWLSFHGGRGVSTILGSLAVLFPVGAIYLLFALGLGKVVKAGAITVILALSTMPLLVLLLKKPFPLVLFTLLVFLLCLIKRIEANREPLPQRNKKTVILRRILLDRDIQDYHYWLHRQR
ncbi:MAG: glycerol-3-phosphate acyltransferase [candidate division WOR-3 bacterium]|jgi:glycerol-3-phosphate acyltransferase PlsY